MTDAETKRLIAMLAAAYRTSLDPHTLAVYTPMLNELQNPETAEAAVGLLIRESAWFPSVSEIRDAYKRTAEYQPKPPALDEPALSEEQRLSNVDRARALTDRMDAHIKERLERWQGPRTPIPDDPKHPIWTDNPDTAPKPVPVMEEGKEAAA